MSQTWNICRIIPEILLSQWILDKISLRKSSKCNKIQYIPAVEAHPSCLKYSPLLKLIVMKTDKTSFWILSASGQLRMQFPAVYGRILLGLKCTFLILQTLRPENTLFVVNCSIYSCQSKCSCCRGNDQFGKCNKNKFNFM